MSHMNSLATVLLVGATGAFGERLAEGLVRANIGVIGVARDKARLDALAQRLGPLFKAHAMDRTGLTAETLGSLREHTAGLFAVADASGPFQSSDYALPRAAIGAGLHYVDLADARDFVRDIRALNDDAAKANVAVLAGASSTPAISHAVLDTLVADARTVTSVDVSIVPGNRAPRGLSVVRAILSTLGQPVRVFRNGEWRQDRGWGLGKTIDLPGLGRRNVALCETPDLDLLVERYRPTTHAIFHAGLELGILHDGVRALGLLVRAGLLQSLAPFARPLRWCADLFKPFGSDRGGMQVDALVIDASGTRKRKQWTLIAEAGDGPYIPTLPALAALKMLARNELTWRGAAPCVGLIPYRQIASAFEDHNISVATREEMLPPPLFRQLLGEDFDRLPAAIRAAHDVHGTVTLEGLAEASGPDNVLGRLVAWLFRLPGGGAQMPVLVNMQREKDGSETWARKYPTVTMRSNLRNPDPSTREVDEVFGALSVRLQWSVREDGLSLRTIGARFLGVSLPRFLVPRSDATEGIDTDGHFTFDVPIALPLAGTIVHYRGTLKIVSSAG